VKRKTESPSAAICREAVDYLRREGRELSLPEETVVLHQGEPGEAFYVVLEGTLEVRLVGAGGRSLLLTTMSPGSSFGEMSLITGEPVSAEVVSSSPVVLLAFPGKLFSTALAECEPFRSHIMKGLAAKLRSTSTDAWNFFQKAETLDILRDKSYKAGPLVAESVKMGKVEERIAAFASHSRPVLVRGGAGTGKAFVAAKIHEKSTAEEAPFIVLDCRSLKKEESETFIFGSARFRGDAGESNGSAGGLQHFGAIHLAQRGTILLRHVEALSRSSQENLEGYLAGIDDGTLTYPVTRVIATTREDLRDPSGEDRFFAPLCERLAKNEINVPLLAQRRKDILPLSRQFLKEMSEGARCQIHRSAAHAIVSQRYGYGNASELREAVEMAALFAEGEEIRAEHIFTGPKEESSASEFDLGSLPLVQRLISDRALAVFRSLMLASFSVIVLLCLFRSRTTEGRLANVLIWGVWEPALIFLFFLAGRVWCTVCPLSTAGRMAGRGATLGLPPPDWLKRHASWLIMGGLLVIIWSEQVFSMSEHPLPSGILLAALMGVAILFALLFRRESWCRYACPLGNIGAIFALPAVLNIRSNPSVCSTYCRTHDCYKGNESRSGCPVYHHPLYARDGHHCKLCFSCLKSCPHGSAKLYLRPPLQSLWRQGGVGDTLVPFAILYFAVSPFLLAAQHFPATGTAGLFTLGLLAALLFALALRSALPKILSRDESSGTEAATRSAFALLVLAWGPAMAWQLEHIPGLASLRVHPETGSYLADLFPAGGVSLLAVVQIGIIVAAASFASVSLRGLVNRFRLQEQETSSRGWKVVTAMCVAYLAAAVAVVVLGP
jgi:transcriptional regulator with AAA-type ATPase domain